MTTFIGQYKDRYRIEKWYQAKVATGVATSDDLAKLIREAADAKALESLVELAATHAGADEKRNLGTAIHAATEAADRTDGPYDGPHVAEVAAWRSACDEHNLVVHSDMIEMSLAHEVYNVCGTADRLVETDYGLVVLDIKTGSVDRNGGEFAMQLHCYASATHWWDWRNDRLMAMPDVNQDVGIIAHLQPGGPCTLYWVDLRHGKDGCEKALWIRDDWRKRKGILAPLDGNAPSFAKRRTARKATPPKPKATKPKATKPLSVDDAAALVPDIASLRITDGDAYRIVADTIADAVKKDRKWATDGKYASHVPKLKALCALAKHLQDVDLARAVVIDVQVPSDGSADASDVAKQRATQWEFDLSGLLELSSDDECAHIVGVANVADMAFAADGVPYVKSYTFGYAARRAHILEHLAPLLEADKAKVAARWPEDVPPPKRSEEWNDNQMAAIERQYGLPFWPYDPKERQR